MILPSWDPSGLAKYRTSPNWNPYGLAKYDPFGLAKNRTPPSWDPFGSEKFDPFGLEKDRALRIGTPPHSHKTITQDPSGYGLRAYYVKSTN